MNQLLYYLLQVIAASALLYGYYHFALRNNKFHRYNRFYLLSGVLFSILIPFLNIPVYFTAEETDSSLVLHTLTVISSPASELPLSRPTANEEIHVNWFTLSNILYTAYAFAAFLVFVRILFSLKKIRSIANNNPVEKLGNINFVNTDEPGTPFSFFRWLFWNRKIELQSEKGEQIFRHELFHIQQKHSWDILLMELLTVIFWINPFFHLIKKELKAIHEFLADEFAINEKGKWQYAELLLMQAFSTQNNLVIPFFHNMIKRRIAMITSSEKPGYQYLRKLMVLPIATIVTGLFAFNYMATPKTKYDILIEGFVRHLPDGKVYLTEAHNWTVFLDSTISKNGHFLFKIKTDPEFIPFMASIAYPDKNADFKIGQLMFANEFILPPKTAKFRNYSNSGFYLEEGITEITDNNSEQPYKVPSGATIIPVKIKAGKETEIMYKNFSTEFGWSGGNSAAQIMKIASLKKMIKQYPFSYFLLQSIFNERGKYSKEELRDLLLHFNKDVQVSKLGDRLKAYLKNGPKPGEQTSIVDTVKPGTQKFLIIIDGKELEEKLSLNELEKIINDGKEKKAEITGKGLNKKNIQSVNILKDESAVLKYGEKGKNGVIEIYTKANNIIFKKVEIEPSFPGGEAAWKEFLEKNLDLNIPVKNNAPAGIYTILVHFIVTKEGDVINLNVISKYGYGMVEEAIRLIRLSGKWLPAIQNGHKVAAYKRQAITFIVPKEKGISFVVNTDTIPVTRNYNDPSMWNYNDSSFLKWRKEAISEILTIARTEGKAAYYYKGRTYVFARIDNSMPSNINSYYETDGLQTVFLLNGKLIYSIEEINSRYKRSDIKSLNLIFSSEARAKYNIDAGIPDIQTF